jgi:Zn-dependent protease
MGALALLVWYAYVGLLLFPFSSGPHELGHALAARASGVSIEAIRVWPLVFLRDPQRRFRLSANLDAPGDVGGSVHWTATGTPPTHASLFRIVAAGPLANGICALLFAGAALTLGERPRTAHGLGALLWAAAAMNLAVMLSNLVPRRAYNGMPTDGAQILALLRRR